MSDSNKDDEGPVIRFEWNFPVIRMVSRKTEDISQGFNSVSASDIPQRLKEAAPSIRQSNEDNRQSEVRDRIEKLRSNRDLKLSQEDSIVTVTYEDGVFIPVKASVDEDSAVEFENNSDEAVTIVSNGGPTSINEQISSGDTVEVEFGEEGVVRYGIDEADMSETCGAVIVGDAELDSELECEEDIDRELFQSEVSTRTIQSMSTAADEKEREY